METRDEAGEMGQVCWKRKGEVWEVRHLQDQGVAVGQLRDVATLDELEEVVRWDERGNYRPLRSEAIQYQCVFGPYRYQHRVC